MGYSYRSNRLRSQKRSNVEGSQPTAFPTASVPVSNQAAGTITIYDSTSQRALTHLIIPPAIVIAEHYGTNYCFSDLFALLPEQLELDTVDGHCGHLKQFRCSRLQDYLEDLRYSNLEFFDACWELLETAVPESNPKRSDKNPHTGNVVISDWKKEMMKRSYRSADLLDKMIWQCNQSDLGLLQPFWQAAVSEIDEALFLLHELIIHPTIRKPATLPTVRMVNMSIPIVKLTRLFFKKLSETATIDSMIRATSGINTWEFLIQVDITQTLARHVRDDLLLFLWRARGEESIEVVEAVNIRGAVEDIRYQFFNSLDRWRELVVPVPRQRDDRSPNQINFEDCFNLLEDQFVLATNKFFDLFTALDTVGSRELGF
ncbi:hypothetical protein PSTT_14395 [Puccinia striiformis]|uniref:Uncharacterized protein n=1 Tax=Puccinia striiformis TaxID=27350 RepID=A0A2S4UMN9_9BASI|nr:hypothetical protein PSTT_14395 [Puccinia striiformis]